MFKQSQLSILPHPRHKFWDFVYLTHDRLYTLSFVAGSELGPCSLCTIVHSATCSDMIQLACVACIDSYNNLQIVRQGQGNSFPLYPVLVKVITVMKDIDQSSMGEAGLFDFCFLKESP